MGKATGTRKDKVQLILPGSPFGMDHRPRDVFDFTEDMSIDQLQRYMEELKARGVDVTLDGLVVAYEAAEDSSGLADAWGYVDPGYIDEDAHRAIQEQTEAYLARGGTITVIE